MQTLQIDSAKIAYEEQGQGDPLLFIHGIYASQRQWVQQVNHFAPTHRVITCDLRGHGQSSASSDRYSVILFANDIIALLDHLELERVTCCGHSFGGLVAQEMALTHPDRVRALILAETLYGVSSTPWEAVTSYSLNVLVPQLVGTKSYVEMMARYFGLYTPGGAQFIINEADRHLDDPANQQNILNASLAFDSRWRLHQIKCPTLLMIGQFPHILPVYWHNWEMWWRITNAQLKIIPAAGHMLFWDNPLAFNQTITNFLAELPAN
jgi:pimeloyl-ACP methyl ester carboxylesterase